MQICHADTEEQMMKEDSNKIWNISLNSKKLHRVALLWYGYERAV